MKESENWEESLSSQKRGVERSLEKKCRRAIYEFSLLNQEKEIAVALSGGKDSITLLLLLHFLAGKGFPNWKIHALHVGGAYSCGANLSLPLLRRICEKREICLTICPSQTERETNCYSCSRKRRRLLFEKMRQLGVETIAFGHHADDAIQTTVMNLFHKGEFATHLPKIHMRQYGVTIIRPLIYIREEEIVSFAQKHGFLRRTCQCPIGARSMRKRVKDLLEIVKGEFPHTHGNLLKASLLYGSQKSAL